MHWAFALLTVPLSFDKYHTTFPLCRHQRRDGATGLQARDDNRMETAASIRKRIRHYDIPGHAHGLTFSCFQRENLLNDDRIRLMFLEQLASIRTKTRFQIGAYVLMPNHIHLIVRSTNDSYSIAAFLHNLKFPVGYRAKMMLRHNDVDVERFWQAGPGFDENLTDVSRIAQLTEYIHNNPIRAGLVSDSTGWRWSSARFWAGWAQFDLRMDIIT